MQVLISAMPKPEHPYDLLDRLRRFDTCTLSNAIERLEIRPRNEGFMSGKMSCIFPQMPPVIGFAVTGRMRSSMPPVRGKCYYEHIEWWRYVAGVAGPKIVVVHDADHAAGTGALFGEAYARISRKLGCVACVTNGAVRDVPGIEAIGFQVFARGFSVSHAYAHVVDFGEPVEIGGLRIGPGDLLHADLHGVHVIPAEGIDRLESLAQDVLRDDRDLFCLTERKDFSVDLLAAKLAQAKSRNLCK